MLKMKGSSLMTECVFYYTNIYGALTLCQHYCYQWGCKCKLDRLSTPGTYNSIWKTQHKIITCAVEAAHCVLSIVEKGFCTKNLILSQVVHSPWPNKFDITCLLFAPNSCFYKLFPNYFHGFPLSFSYLSTFLLYSENCLTPALKPQWFPFLLHRFYNSFISSDSDKVFIMKKK